MQQKRTLVGGATPKQRKRRTLVGSVAPVVRQDHELDADGKVIDPVRPRCGAHSKRSSLPCRNWAMANGRCRMHGGNNKGPPPEKLIGNDNARSHGLYADGLHPNEFDLYGTIEIGNLRDEIRMTRVLLKRAFRAQLAWEMVRGELNRADDATVKAAMIGSGLYNIDEMSTERGVAGMDKDGYPVDIDKNRIVRRKTSFVDEIRHYERLLTKLEQTHQQLQDEGGDEDTVARLAEDLRAFNENAESTMPGGEV